MNGFRKWTLGVYAKFDDLLGQVENHEAIASQALLDMKTSLARAKGQLSRVDRDCRALEQDVRAAQASAEQWKARAAKETEDKRAMECIRRARFKLKDADALRARLDEQTRMRDQVTLTVRNLEQKFLELSGKKRLLSTRQAAARASEAISAESGTSVEVEDVFSRWEIKLTEKEFVPGYEAELPDEFADKYAEKEEEESLLRELASLREDGDDRLTTNTTDDDEEKAS